MGAWLNWEGGGGGGGIPVKARVGNKILCEIMGMLNRKIEGHKGKTV